MDPVLRYRGRLVAAADVSFIGHLIAEHPQVSRRSGVCRLNCLHDGICD